VVFSARYWRVSWDIIKVLRFKAEEALTEENVALNTVTQLFTRESVLLR